MNALNSSNPLTRRRQCDSAGVSAITLCAAWMSLLLHGGTAGAADAGAAATVVSSADILNLIFGLLLVIVIFLGIAYVLKRLTGGAVMSRGHLKVIDTLHLGAREKVILVRAVNNYLVLGVCPGNIHALHALTGPLPDLAEMEPDFKTRLQGALAAARGNHG